MPATLANVHPSLRAAWRERLATCVDIDVSLSVTAAGGVFTRASGSWINDRFAVGQEIAVTGLSGGNGTVIVRAVQDLTLTTSGAGSGGGTARFVAGLPQGRAYEGGATYTPTMPFPFVQEVFKPASTERRGAGPRGLIAHLITANATLFYPGRIGTLAIEQMAGAMMAHFKPGTMLTRGQSSGVVLQVSRTDLMPDGEWVSCAVSVTIQAHSFD